VPTALNWASDGLDWPCREHSTFVDAAGLHWHVQRHVATAAGAEEPPRLLLLHGTGASTHSWRGLLPLLGQRFSWLAVDLPGHGFTSKPESRQLSLPGMAAAVSELLGTLDWRPTLAVGHSAGAAILVRMALDGRLPAQAIGAINGAFLPFGGVAAPIFSPLARLLYAADWVPRLFARRAADPKVVERLVSGTGSTLDAEGLALYARLMRCPAHTEAALGMMAHWDLRGLARDLPRLRTPLHLLVGAGDRAVAPRQARQVVLRRPGTTLVTLPRLGHLAHEEDPVAVAAWLGALAGTDGRSAGPRV
jgi:magnesium chelatase accessory protein